MISLSTVKMLLSDYYCQHLLIVALFVLSWHRTNGMLICQNGGTFDPVNKDCICKPYYYGKLCETSFAMSDPCTDSANVKVLNDSQAAHRLGNTKVFSPDRHCIDFSIIHAGWYLLVSPAGGDLVIGTPSGTVACGSENPYFVVNETIKQEDNVNRRLFKAKAYRYRPGVQGFLPDDTSYPVRILECSPTRKLYYLQPLPSFLYHYCIGSRQPCVANQTSLSTLQFEPCPKSPLCQPKLVENSVAPRLTLDYKNKSNGQFSASFRCHVSAAFQQHKNQAEAFLQRVAFKLTYYNGTSVEVASCNFQNVSIQSGKIKIFECSSELIFAKGTSVFGGSLTCQHTAKCVQADDISSVTIESNSHGFYFKHYFEGEGSVLKPGKPTTICIDSEKVPALTAVTFYISVGRQQIMLTDRVDVAVLKKRDGNGSLECGMVMRNDRYKNKKICFDLVLYNHDPDNRITLGLTKGQQISIVRINISFSSTADGLYTVLNNGSTFLQRIQDIEMKIDLSGLQTDVTTYLHLYTGPWVKTAKSAYTKEKIFTVSGGFYSLISHKMLPYEIQAKVEGRHVTEIFIRYLYYLIWIRGSSTTGNILDPVVKHKLPGQLFLDSRNSVLPLQADGLPFGVTVTNVGYAMKVRFDLYGTILYVWGFTTSNRGSCVSDFVLKNANMQASTSCKKQFTSVGNSRIALDVMVVPGFYDTPALVDGLIYGANRSTIDARSSMFSSQFQMPVMKDYSMRPTEVLGICTCDKTKLKIKDCFVSINKIQRSGPTAQAIPLTQKEDKFPSLTTRKISQKEADDFCTKFVNLQVSRSVSTDICSQTKDPTGQADYISQFKLICAQYATVLGTFASSQSLFNSMLGMCYTDMTYNATEVLGNSGKIESLVKNQCPASCSGRGECLSGECACADGFWGAGCEFEVSMRDQILDKGSIEIRLLQRSMLCSSDNCSAVYLIVKPLLKSNNSVCHIQANSSANSSVPSVYISADTVKCELQDLHQSLVKELRMFRLVQISLTATNWKSNNAVPLLLHQAQCGGKPVRCSSDSLTCQAEGLQTEEKNVCPSNERPTPKRGSGHAALSLLVVLGVLVALV